MTIWDMFLLWLVAKLVGPKTTGPEWPGPTGPTGPTGPGATGPGATGPGPTGPGPTGPTGPTGPGAAGGTVWKPYFYIQPDAGAKLGTLYALAGDWHGKGTAWTQLYNFTKGRNIADVPSGKGAGKSAKPVVEKSMQYDADTGQITGSVGEEQSSPNYADKGDKLLVPFEWPETTNQTILTRLEPIPMGTALPGVPASSIVHGDDGPGTL